MSNCNCNNISLPTGANGLNGYNAFTVTTASFTCPAFSGSETIAVSASSQYTGIWAVAGQVIFIETAGYFSVTSSTQTSMVVVNLGYTGNASSGTIASGVKVSPAGLVGTTGANGTDGTTVIAINHSNSATSQTGSYATLITTSMNAGQVGVGDSINIQCRLFYNRVSSGNNDSQVKIRLVENANTVELLLTPTAFFGGADYVLLTKNYDFLDVNIIATWASATTVSWEYEWKMGLSADYALSEYSFPTSGSFGMGSKQTGTSTVTWANQVDVVILGQVDNASDEVKLSFYELDYKKLF